MGLSDSVADAVPRAVKAIEEVVSQLLAPAGG